MYKHVAVFTLEGDFLGYCIKNQDANNLQSTNLYAEDEGEELQKRLSELNNSSALASVWPDARDFNVQALVNDLSFEPIEYVEEEVIDDENSYLVYIKDTDGEDTFDLDEESSVLVYKTAKVPARPSDYFARTKRAQEVVAQQRLTSA